MTNNKQNMEELRIHANALGYILHFTAGDFTLQSFHGTDTYTFSTLEGAEHFLEDLEDINS